MAAFFLEWSHWPGDRWREPLGNGADQRQLKAPEQHAAPAKTRSRARRRPAGNPLWGIPVDSAVRHARAAALFGVPAPARAAASLRCRSPKPRRHRRRRTGAASIHSRGNRDRHSRKMSRSFFDQTTQKPCSSSCRRSGFRLVFALGRFADDDPREKQPGGERGSPRAWRGACRNGSFSGRFRRRAPILSAAPVKT